jgi:hypothetical protein
MPDQGKPEIGLAFLKDSETEKALKALYEYVEARAREQVRWYWKKKEWKARMSWMLRLVVILLFFLGGLVPILKAAFPNLLTTRFGNSVDLGQLGYLLIAVAAGCLGLDRFFGFSSGWIRYVTTAMSIERSLEEFRMEWARITAMCEGRPPGADVMNQLVLLARQFIVSVLAQVEQETKVWAAEFQSSLSQLESDIKARAQAAKKEATEQASASRPGAISLAVTNGQEADQGFSVSMDGQTVENQVHGDKCEIMPVAPGLHKIRITGVIGGETAIASDTVTVEPGAIAKVTLNLVKAKEA